MLSVHIATTALALQQRRPPAKKRPPVVDDDDDVYKGRKVSWAPMDTCYRDDGTSYIIGKQLKKKDKRICPMALWLHALLPLQQQQ
jgi:hypothetical protein